MYIHENIHENMCTFARMHIVSAGAQTAVVKYVNMYVPA